ncbi:MAG: hypothetical protein MJ238_03615 [Bacilli bacterium]|nr:hypothetical protein [Bacilli bacterium]
MKKNIAVMLLASSALLAVSCGSNNASSSSSNWYNPISSSEPEEIKVKKAFRYLRGDLEEIAEQNNSGFLYSPIENLDYDVMINMANKSEDEETGEEKWTSAGFGLDIEEGTILLNGCNSSSPKGLLAEVDLEKVKLWQIIDNLEVYQKVPRLSAYYDGESEAAYVDFSDAALLRLLLNTLIRESFPEEEEPVVPEEGGEISMPVEETPWSLPTRLKLPQGEREKFLLNLLTPVSNRMGSVVNWLVDRIQSSYGENGSDYCYFDPTQVKSGYYLQWNVNDIEELSSMVTDILSNSGYNQIIIDSVSSVIDNLADSIESFSLKAGISWTYEELRSISLTVEAKFDDEYQKANLEEDASSYLSYIAMEGKFTPILEAASEIKKPDFSKYSEMDPIPGQEEAEDNDDFWKLLNDLLNREDNTPEWTWPDFGDDWEDEIRDWISSILG